MGTFIEKLCGDRIDTVEVCGSLPARRIRTPLLQAPIEATLDLIDRIAESAPPSRCFKDDPRMPRCFLRITGNKASHTLEVQPEYAYLDEWVYTPGRELWNFLSTIPGLLQDLNPSGV